MMLDNPEPFRLFDEEPEYSEIYSLRVLKHIDYPIPSLDPENDNGTLCYIGYLIFKKLFTSDLYYLSAWLELEQYNMIENFDPYNDHFTCELTEDEVESLEDDCNNSHDMRIVLKIFLWNVQLIINRELSNISHIVSHDYSNITFITKDNMTKTIPLFNFEYITKQMNIERFKDKAVEEYITNQCYNIDNPNFKMLDHPDRLKFNSDFLPTIYEFDIASFTFTLRSDEELNEILTNEFILNTLLSECCVQPLTVYNVIYDFIEWDEEERQKFYIPLIKHKIFTRSPPFDKNYTIHNFIYYIKANDYTSFHEFKELNFLKAIIDLETTNKRTNGIKLNDTTISISSPKIIRLLSFFDTEWLTNPFHSNKCLLDWLDIIGIQIHQNTRKPSFTITLDDWNKFKLFMTE